MTDTKTPKKHAQKRLTDMQVRKLSEKGRYGDGLGLNLVITPSGSKQWVLRIMVNGRRREIGLGGYPTISLSAAREETLKMRRQAKQGQDPVALRNASHRIVPTFEEAARKVHQDNIPTWKETKAVVQWISSMENYVFPIIGNMRVNDISPQDIMSVLSPIWIEKHSTANRVRQRMSRVFDWAKTQEFTSGENPVTGIKQGLPKTQIRIKHFAAMPYEDISPFISHLQTSSQSPTVKLGMEFLILTACRSGELRYAKWSEIDLEARRWSIPAERMKASREHVVPLTERSMGILCEVSALSSNSQYIFPSSQNWIKPMSDATLTKALKKGLGYLYTVHGFRSTFRDWASETRTYPNDIVEMALAHTNKNKTEAAYKRGNLFEKRKVLMNDWSNYCGGECNDRS